MSPIGHIKIALTTNSLTHVDVSFTGARQVVFYDVSYDTREFLEVTRFAVARRVEEGATETPQPAPALRPGMGRNGGSCMADAGLDGGDRLLERVEAIRGCAILFCRELNDLAAVRLRDAGVFPVKMEQRRDIDAVIDALQKMMNNNPPLWLRKTLGYGLRNPEYQLSTAA